MITIPALTATERVDMERHDVVRCALDLLTRDFEIPRDLVHRHVVNILLESCEKQERWSR